MRAGQFCTGTHSNGVFVMDPQIIIEDLEHISTHGRSQARNLLNDTMLLARLRSDSTVYCLIEHTEWCFPKHALQFEAWATFAGSKY